MLFVSVALDSDHDPMKTLARRLPLVMLLAALDTPATAQIPGEEAAAVRQRFRDGILHWGGDAEGGAPYQYRDPDEPGRVIGFEVELADALADGISRQYGIEVRAQFVQYDWVSLPLGLTKRDFDVAISGLEVTPDNLETMAFSRPYYIYDQQLVVRSDEDRVHSLADCQQLAVGTLSGSAAERILRDCGVADIHGYDGQTEPYSDLELGRLDAVLLDSPIAAIYAARKPRLKFVGRPFAVGEYAVAIRKDDAVLKTALDRAIGDAIATGRLRKILIDNHLWTENQQALARGVQRAAELDRLGFTTDGLANIPPAELLGPQADVPAESARSWTFDRYAPLLLAGAGMTVFLSVTSMLLAVALGLIVSVARMYGPAPVRAAALAYIEFFRGVPLLLVLIFLYYGLPTFGLEMSGVPTAILGFGLTFAAYEAEIYRSAIEAVPVGQWDAAHALGMSSPLAFRRIILPQALRTALGPITNDFVSLFKDTSLVSVIAVHELTKEYQLLSRSSFKFVEMGLLTAALYLVMSVPLGYLSRWLETRTGARHI